MGHFPQPLSLEVQEIFGLPIAYNFFARCHFDQLRIALKSASLVLGLRINTWWGGIVDRLVNAWVMVTKEERLLRRRPLVGQNTLLRATGVSSIQVPWVISNDIDHWIRVTPWALGSSPLLPPIPFLFFQLLRFLERWQFEIFRDDHIFFRSIFGKFEHDHSVEFLSTILVNTKIPFNFVKSFEFGHVSRLFSIFFTDVLGLKTSDIIGKLDEAHACIFALCWNLVVFELWVQHIVFVWSVVLEGWGVQCMLVVVVIDLLATHAQEHWLVFAGVFLLYF